MFMVRWIRRLLSLPLQWLGQGAVWINAGVDIPLLSAAWRVGGDGRVAKLALSRVYKTYGLAAALAQAQLWMQQAPSPEIAAIGGLMALDAGQVDTAGEMLQAGRQLGTDEQGFLELLEWQLAARRHDTQAVQELMRRFEARRDLAPMLRRMVLCSLLWDAVTERRFDEADQRARYLLGIEEVPEAHMALWATALQDGDVQLAERHLAAASMPPARKLYYQILGNAVIGFREQAKALLAQMRQSEPAAADHLEQQLTSRGVLS